MLRIFYFISTLITLLLSELKTSEQLTLTSGHDNVFDCVLRDKVEASDSQTPIIARIKFLFRKRPQTTTTMTTSTSTTVPIGKFIFSENHNGLEHPQPLIQNSLSFFRIGLTHKNNRLSLGRNELTYNY